MSIFNRHPWRGLLELGGDAKRSYLLAMSSILLALAAFAAPVLIGLSFLIAIGVLIHSCIRRTRAWLPAFAGICASFGVFLVMDRYEHYRWPMAQNSDSRVGYFRYLESFPNGEHSAEARARLDALVKEENQALANRRKERTRPLESFASELASESTTADQFSPPVFAVNPESDELPSALSYSLPMTDDPTKAKTFVTFRIQESTVGQYIGVVTGHVGGPAISYSITVHAVDVNDRTRHYAATVTTHPDKRSTGSGGGAGSCVIPKTGKEFQFVVPAQVVAEIISSIMAK